VKDDLAFRQPARQLSFIDLFADQDAQVRFELLLELVGHLEGAEGRLERAVVVEEPAPDECLERRELLQPQLPLGLVVQRQRRVSGPTVNDEVRSSARSIGFGRRLQLVDRP